MINFMIVNNIDIKYVNNNIRLQLYAISVNSVEDFPPKSSLKHVQFLHMDYPCPQRTSRYHQLTIQHLLVEKNIKGLFELLSPVHNLIVFHTYPVLRFYELNNLETVHIVHSKVVFKVFDMRSFGIGQEIFCRVPGGFSSFSSVPHCFSRLLTRIWVIKVFHIAELIDLEDGLSLGQLRSSVDFFGSFLSWLAL